MTKNYDIIIIGGGPAGMSAALYAARGGSSVAIIDIELLGGKPMNYAEIENYLGFPSISGFDLSEKFEEHINKFSIDKYPCSQIISVDLKNKEIITDNSTFKAKSIIIATGSSAKKLNIAGEDEFVGKGVSYCAICDAPFYINKDVAVIGGGNSAIEEACYLTKFANKVYIIHRRDTFRADSVIVERAKNNPKIEFICKYIPVEIIGKDYVNQLKIRSLEGSEERLIKVGGIFPYIGTKANTELFKDQISLEESGFIKVDEYKRVSNTSGVFAIGDVTTSVCKQVITAVADGAIAGVMASAYVDMVDEEIIKV